VSAPPAKAGQARSRAAGARVADPKRRPFPPKADPPSAEDRREGRRVLHRP